RMHPHWHRVHFWLERGPTADNHLVTSMTLPVRTAPRRASLPCAPELADRFLSAPTPQVVAAVAAAPGPFLVLGAAGKLGLDLALMPRRALDQLGRADVVVAVARFRSLRAAAEFEAQGLVPHACDLADAAAVAALPEAPTVFYLAGVKFGTAGDPNLLQRLNVEVPRLVAERFRRSRIVAFSSGNVYPFVRPDSGGASEATPPQPVGDYAASCVAREQVFAEAAERHGTPVVLIRLNYAVEFRYGLLVDLAQQVRQGLPV